MSATDSGNLFPASLLPPAFNTSFLTGSKVFASLARDSQRNLQSLMTFQLRQAENARLTASALFSDLQPLMKTTDPAEFLRTWLDTAEKRSVEVVNRFRESVDDLRDEVFKAAEQVVEDVTSEAQEPAAAPAKKSAAKLPEAKSA